jgi:predicted CxxxxCH...CXXCH cytochrome family protein
MLRLTRPPRGSLLLASLLAAALSCAKARSDVVGTRRCVSWKEEIGPLFHARCQTCHGGDAPAGHYDTSSYSGVLAGGSDAEPNARAGDPGSRLLVTLDPGTAEDVHQAAGVSDVFPTVRTWVVDCGLSFVRSSIHGGGIMDPTSSDFHGRVLRNEKYQLGVCEKCHGNDARGGTSGVSCLTCHADGATACSTCHSTIGAKGSHVRHLGGGPLGLSYACGECHVAPRVYTDVGHIFLADGSLDPPPAEVTFGAAAGLTPAGATRAAPPSFDPATQRCDNIYCHGATLTDDAATNTQPVWNTAGTGQADCGSCHGLPPNHGNKAKCVACHSSVVDADRKIIAPEKHIDGKLQLGDPAAGCTGCHGGLMDPAPPRALGGETSRSASGVGAHQAHLKGTGRFRGPIACGECHRVPTEVTSPGHFSGHTAGGDIDDVDVAAEVFPVDPTVGVLASARGATPRWDHASATCAGVYCHGGGTVLAADTSPGIDHAPLWTAIDGLTCGEACHALPPASGPHSAAMTLADCATCHSRTVDRAGTVIISGAPGAETSTHINGVVDVAR